jgi:hypothetical protein
VAQHGKVGSKIAFLDTQRFQEGFQGQRPHSLRAA